MTRLLICEGPCTPPEALAAYDAEAHAHGQELTVPSRTRHVHPMDRGRLLAARRALVYTPHRGFAYHVDWFQCPVCGTLRRYGETDGPPPATLVRRTLDELPA